MDTEVVTDQSIEDKLAAAYEREDKANQPVREEPPAKPEPEETTSEADTQETEDSTESEEETAVEDGYEDTEYEGKQYRVPKELKDALLRQKDYTQKTQGVAEKERLLSERDNSLQVKEAFQREHFAKAVEFHTLQSQFQQFDKVDWSKLAEEAPSEYLKLDRQYRDIERKMQVAHQEMSALQGQFGQKMLETRQKAQQQCLQELKRDFPELSNAEKGPVLLRELNDTGLSFGFNAQELEGIVDPRMVRVLHAASQWKKLQAAKPVIEKRVAIAKPIQGQAGRSSATTQHNATYQDLKAKMHKSGKAADAEAFLLAAMTRKRS